MLPFGVSTFLPTVQIDGIPQHFSPAVLATRVSSKTPQPIAPFTPEYSERMDMDDNKSAKADRQAALFALAERLTGRVASSLDQTPDVA